MQSDIIQTVDAYGVNINHGMLEINKTQKMKKKNRRSARVLFLQGKIMVLNDVII